MKYYTLLLSLLCGCGSDGAIDVNVGDHPPDNVPQVVDHYEGGAVLAAMNDRFPCDAFISSVRSAKYPAMAVLWKTFGDDMSCVSKFTDAFKDRPHLLEIHFSNETCRRSKCEKEELFPSWSVREMNAALERDDKALGDAVNSRMLDIYAAAESVRKPTTRLVVSTGLEDNYTNRAFDRMFQWVSSVWLDEVVRSPVNYGETYKGRADLMEKHSPNPNFAHQNCIASEDGLYNRSTLSTRMYFQDNSHCLATLWWRPAHQGRADGVALTPPKTRKFIFSEQDVNDLRSVYTE